MPNAKLFLPDTLVPSELISYEPPATLMTFNEILMGRVITGCKSYQSLVGGMTKENQTTLADTQKKMLQNLATTIQTKVDSIRD